MFKLVNATTVLRVPRELLLLLLLLLLTACIHRMYLFPRFLDPERAEHVVQLARSRLAPSALALRKGDKEAEKSYVPMCPLTGTLLQSAQCVDHQLQTVAGKGRASQHGVEHAQAWLLQERADKSGHLHCQARGQAGGPGLDGGQDRLPDRHPCQSWGGA